MNEPIPVPSIVFGFVIVGLIVVVLQQTPREVIVAPPSLVIAPPLIAVFCVINDVEFVDMTAN